MIGIMRQKLMWLRDPLTRLPKKMVIATKAINPGKATEFSKLCPETISSCGKVRISEVVEVCNWALDGKEMRIKGKQAC